MPELNSRLVGVDEPGGNRNLNLKIKAQKNKRNKAISTNFEFKNILMRIFRSISQLKENHIYIIVKDELYQIT